MNIIIHGSDYESHDRALQAAIRQIRENNLNLNKDECQFGVKQLIFLGDLLTDTGVKPDPKKDSAILNMPKPKNKAGIQRFLSMVTYLAKWIPEMSQKTAPLRELISDKNEWQ